MPECPFCAEEIQGTETACPHCESPLTPVKPQQVSSSGIHGEAASVGSQKPVEAAPPTVPTWAEPVLEQDLAAAARGHSRAKIVLALVALVVLSLVVVVAMWFMNRLDLQKARTEAHAYIRQAEPLFEDDAEAAEEFERKAKLAKEDGDLAATVELLQKACHAGAEPSTCLKVGKAYLDGEHVARDLTRAAVYFGRACDDEWRGLPLACQRFDEVVQIVKDEGWVVADAPTVESKATITPEVAKQRVGDLVGLLRRHAEPGSHDQPIELAQAIRGLRLDSLDGPLREAYGAEAGALVRSLKEIAEANRKFDSSTEKAEAELGKIQREIDSLDSEIERLSAEGYERVSLLCTRRFDTHPSGKGIYECKVLHGLLPGKRVALIASEGQVSTDVTQVVQNYQSGKSNEYVVQNLGEQPYKMVETTPFNSREYEEYFVTYLAVDADSNPDKKKAERAEKGREFSRQVSESDSAKEDALLQLLKTTREAAVGALAAMGEEVPSQRPHGEPRVAIAKMEKSFGAIDVGGVRKKIDGAVGALSACYENLLVLEPEAALDVSMRLSIVSPGVLKILEVQTKGIDSKLEACLRDAIPQSGYPDPTNDSQWANVDIVFAFTLEKGAGGS